MNTPYSCYKPLAVHPSTTKHFLEVDFYYAKFALVRVIVEGLIHSSYQVVCTRYKKNAGAVSYSRYVVVHCTVYYSVFVCARQAVRIALLVQAA